MELRHSVILVDSGILDLAQKSQYPNPDSTDRLRNCGSYTREPTDVESVNGLAEDLMLIHSAKSL
jgi:hypothetical protein